MKTKLTLLLLILPVMAWAQNTRISDPIGPKTKAKSVSITHATDDPVLLKTPALGQATMANSAPVVIASDQNAVPVSGTVTVPAGASYATAVILLQNAATATGNGTALDTTGLTTVAVQPSGTFTATITLEATVDGTNWQTIAGYQSAANSNFAPSPYSNITNTGRVYRVPVSGFKQFRARISAYTSGSVTVNAVGIADGASVGSAAIIGNNGGNLADAQANTSWLSPYSATDNSVAVGMANANYAYNGATWDRQRVASVFKTFTISASAAETTIWTPTSGKKFRVLGYHLFSDTATVLTIRDNTAGTVIFKDGVAANTRAVANSMGNGVLSAAANNVLTLQCGTAATVNGTVFGTEE